jgi:hypothetical protein
MLEVAFDADEAIKEIDKLHELKRPNAFQKGQLTEDMKEVLAIYVGNGGTAV